MARREGLRSGLLPLLLLLLFLSSLACAIARHAPSESNYGRHSPAENLHHQSPPELSDTGEVSFLDNLPDPVKVAIEEELKACLSFPGATTELCVYDRRALIAFNQDYTLPGSNPNPVVGSPTIG